MASLKITIKPLNGDEVVVENATSLTSVPYADGVLTQTISSALENHQTTDEVTINIKFIPDPAPTETEPKQPVETAETVAGATTETQAEA